MACSIKQFDPKIKDYNTMQFIFEYDMTKVESGYLNDPTSDFIFSSKIVVPRATFLQKYASDCCCYFIRVSMDCFG